VSLRPIAVAAPTISRAWSSCGRIMARLYTLRFLSAVRAVAARCKLPFCPPPRPVPRKCEAHQGNYKRKKSKREGQRKEETKGRPVPLDPSCRRHEVRRGEEQWSPPGARLLRSRSLLVQPLPAPPAQTPRSRRPPLRPAPAFQHPFFFFFLFIHYSCATYGDHDEIMYSPFPVRCPRSGGSSLAPLRPPPRPVPGRWSYSHQGKDTRKGGGLPTSVVERKFSTARPHLSSARRSRIFHRLFHLPVSFPTSAQRIFCWAFHSRHSLRMYSCVVRSSRIVANCGHDA